MDTCEFFKIGQNASDFPRWGDENPEQGDTRVFSPLPPFSVFATFTFIEVGLKTG